MSAALPGAMPGYALDSLTDYRPNHFTYILSFPHTSWSIFILLTARAQSASRAVTGSLVLPKNKAALHLLLDLL